MTTDPTAAPTAPPGLDRVVRACRAMVEAGGPLPTAELAELTGCSERQLVRLFTAHAGTTPRAFGQAVRAGEVRRLLREHEQVTEAIFAAGFGSVRSFYETASPTLGMNPRQYATGARGQALRWTTADTDLGQVLAVAGDLGLAAVRIGPDVGPLLEQVRQEFPAGQVEQDGAGLGRLGVGLRAPSHGDSPG
uniref:helix-turn-helix domain-containing protein n=1 Tax=Actinotalea sp. C106 TaxID=2908644 RepID=UPI002027805B